MIYFMIYIIYPLQNVEKNKDSWQGSLSVSVAAAPCCDEIRWTRGPAEHFFQKSDLVNEQYPVYEAEINGKTRFLWWMWHGPDGHWVLNETPGT